MNTRGGRLNARNICSNHVDHSGTLFDVLCRLSTLDAVLDDCNYCDRDYLEINGGIAMALINSLLLLPPFP